MPSHDRAQSLLERLEIQLSFEPQCPGDVVHGALRVKLIEKPKSLLGKRKRCRLPVCTTWNGLLGRSGRIFLEPELKKGPFCR